MSMRVPRVYSGVRGGLGGATVQVNGLPLMLRLDLRNHSPDGFNWGYAGSGPAQLALALLADALGDDQAALAAYHDFKLQFVCPLQSDRWITCSESILEWYNSDPQRAAFLRRN